MLSNSYYIKPKNVSISTKDSARNKLLAGVNGLANVVKLSIGPKGKCVLIESGRGYANLTKDGVTIANSVCFKDPVQNLGCSIVKSIALKTNDTNGDGTTTATIIAQQIYNSCVDAFNSNINRIKLIEGIKDAMRTVCTKLDESVKPITIKDVYNVAYISSNADTELAGFIENAYNTLGNDAVIDIETVKSRGSALSFTSGYRYNRGLYSSYFLSPNQFERCVLADSPYVLVCQNSVNDIQALVPVLEHVLKEKKELLIIADDVSSQVLDLLILNKLQLGLSLCVAKPPSMGSNSSSFLSDISLYTGGKIFDCKFSEKANVDMLGKVKKAIVSNDSTLLLNGDVSSTAIQSQIDAIDAELKRSAKSSTNTLTMLRERKKLLQAKAAVIQLGGNSDFDVGEKRDRAVDAVSAVRSALKSGVLAGGGISLIAASKSIVKDSSKCDSFNRGLQIVKDACAAPFLAISENAGENGNALLSHLANSPYGYGYDFRTNEYCDLLKRGIVDPKNVVKDSFVNAVEIATLMSNTDAVIVDSVDER